MRKFKWKITYYKISDDKTFYYPAKTYYFNNTAVAKITHKLLLSKALFDKCPIKPSLSYLSKYYIDTNLDVTYQDAGPWRSYHLTASGDSLSELVKDAIISEVDQDGGDLCTYELSSCDDNEVRNAAVKIIIDSVS